MCSSLTSRASLFILNTAFFLLGLGIMGVGLWSQYDKNFSILWNSFDVSKVIDARTLNGASLILIISGLSSVLISFVGLYGTMKRDKCFLTTYCLFMCVILILEIASASVFLSYQNQARDSLRVGLNKTIEKINENDDKVSIKVMDSIQTVFKCCGCQGPADYRNLTEMTSCQTAQSTPEHPDYYQNGCYDTIITYINSHLPVLLSLALSMIILQIFCLISSIRVCSGVRYEGYDVISE